ncbi:hypothetical protein pb186bvf_001572 [Paramecium bursaria]
MKTLLIACLCLSVLSVEMTSAVWSNRDQEILAQVKDTKWAAFIVEYAEITMTTGGVLSELVDAIRQLIDQLNEELQDLKDLYSRRTDEHNRDVTRLEQEIQDGERDIFNGQDMIDNVLYPQRDRFQKALEQLKQNIEENRKNLAEETLSRKKAHEEFVDHVNEHNDAIAAVDESLGLLSQISNPSMVQIKRVQSNLGRIQASFQNHSLFAPIIKALLELATEQNFADQGSLAQLVKIFNELRTQFVQSLNDETNEENAAQEKFVKRVSQLEQEFSEFQRAVLIKTAEISANEQKLQQTQAYTEQRRNDVSTLQAQLAAENDNFARETDIYNGLVTEYTKEISVSEQL